MRVTGAVVGLFAVSVLAGCGGQRPPVPLKSFVLHDVQGLSGGQALWAAEDRTAVMQVVGRPPAGQSGLWEKRYKIQLTPEQWAEVERLVGANRLLTATMAERPGVPDEPHPIIMLVPRSGTTIRVRKWANDEYPGFDPVYAYLLGLCRAEDEPVHEGTFEWKWHPDGFEQPW